MAGDPSSKSAMASSSPAAPAVAGTPDDITGSAFKCCICLDLLYKPIVLACGHISCFWCVYKSMRSSRTSHCAMCRHPYNHFPSICQLLHHLLQRIAPATYKRREKEVLEEERDTETFSPQFLDGQIFKRVHSEEIEKSGENIKKKRNISSEEFSLRENGLEVGICMQVSVNDILCGLCKELLFQPAVLNCGHVYCRSCLYVLIDKPLKCQICHGMHPGDLPNVCLDLDQFLEEQFPREYTTRKQKELEKVGQHDDSSSSFSQESSSHSKKSHVGLDVDSLITHYKVGCDSCGMYPMVGKRYRCKDCKELIGFDLCEACYNSGSKLPGRFNQRHTPDHEFELDNTKIYQKILRSKAVQRVLAYVADNNLGRRYDFSDASQ